MHDASITLLSIVNDVLDVSKLEAGRLELDPQPFAICEFVETVASIFQSEADHKGLALEVILDEDLPDFLTGDSARLRQILINLISNASNSRKRDASA